MRPIDADRLKELFIFTCTGGGLLGKISNMIIEWACSFVDEMPTIDVEPVRHGRWLDGNREKHDGTLYWYRYCSECLHERHDDNEDKDTPYCPECGAKMDGGEKNATN